MATTIVTKSGSGAPTASDLVAGELAVDLTNGRLYTEDSGGTVLELGTNPSGDITFDDSGKAIFGAGSDLQIYHDSATNNNYLEALSSNVAIDTAQFVVRNPSKNTNLFWSPIDGGGKYTAILGHETGGTKLQTTATGIDVTGTVTADGLSVIGDTGFNTGSPNAYAHIVPTDGELNDSFVGLRVSRSLSLKSAQYGTINQSGGSLTLNSTVTTGSASGSVRLLSSADGSTTKNLANFANNNDVIFYEDTGTTPKFFWDASAESLGIGTSSIDGTLHVHTASAGTVTASSQADDLVIENSAEGGMTIITPDDQSARIRFTSPSTTADVGGASIFYRQNINKMSMGTEVAGGILALKSGAGSEGLLLDASGNVGIGVTPKTTNATVTGSLNVNQAGLLVRNSNQAYFTSNMYWDASDQLKSYAAGYGLTSLLVPSDGSHRFYNTTAAATGADQNLTLNETMRIDASGNVLVGTGVSGFGLAVYKGANDVINSFSGTGASSSRSLYTGFHSATSSTAGTLAFNVTTNGNVTNINGSYGTISDIKLKENVVDVSPKLNDLMQVRVVNYNLKESLGYEPTKQIGFIAQELEQVFPAMISESPDRDEEGNDLGTFTKSVKSSVFVPMLIKAIQEQQATIEALTARIAALES